MPESTDVSARTRPLRPLGFVWLFMLLRCSACSLTNPSAPLLVLLSVPLWLGIPAFVDWRRVDQLRRAMYAFAGRRGQILGLGQPDKTESHPPLRIEFVHTAPGAGGGGDLFSSLMRSAGASRRSYTHRFLAIPQMEQVARTMREALGGRRATGQHRDRLAIAERWLHS